MIRRWRWMLLIGGVLALFPGVRWWQTQLELAAIRALLPPIPAEPMHAQAAVTASATGHPSADAPRWQADAFTLGWLFAVKTKPHALPVAHANPGQMRFHLIRSGRAGSPTLSLPPLRSSMDPLWLEYVHEELRLCSAGMSPAYAFLLTELPPWPERFSWLWDCKDVDHALWRATLLDAAQVLHAEHHVRAGLPPSWPPIRFFEQTPVIPHFNPQSQVGGIGGGMRAGGIYFNALHALQTDWLHDAEQRAWSIAHTLAHRSTMPEGLEPAARTLLAPGGFRPALRWRVISPTRATLTIDWAPTLPGLPPDADTSTLPAWALDLDLFSGTVVIATDAVR